MAFIFSVFIWGAILPDAQAWWTYLEHRGAPVASYYLGDDLVYIFNFAVNEDTTHMTVSYGLGKTTGGSEWSWYAAEWSHQSGNDRFWKSKANEHRFTSTGAWYYSGRFVWTDGGYTEYASGDWAENRTTLSASSYFTVNALPNPSGQDAEAIGGNVIDLTWTRWSPRNVVIVRNTTGTFSAPSGGSAPPAIGQAFAGGTLIYNGSGSSFSDTGLEENTQYFYRFFTINNNYYSAGVDAEATTDEVLVPTISVLVDSIDFGETDILSEPAVLSYSVVGSALTNEITVTAPEPFELAVDSEGPFSSSVQLAVEGGTIWVRYGPVEIGEDSGFITHTSEGAVRRELQVSGEGVLMPEVMAPSIFNSTEVILQYFGTSWREIARRMPELAEAGYTALWLPPPFKASGQLSVGFDTCDRFDLGNKPRAGGATKYGTKTDFLYMMQIAHRFGIRVYFDNVMAHTGGFMPQGEPYELNDLGFVPADFHLVRREDGTYYKYDWPDWDDEWQVLYRNPFSWDIATDWGGWNNSFGAHEGARTQKWVGVRQPNNPEYYDFDHEGNHVGFGNVTQEMLDEHPEAFEEEVNDFLMRAVRWFIDVSKADGFRLDAVKHVRADFFGADGAGKDSSNFGYTGQIQWQYNKTHGFEDWDNHRDAVFNPSIPRNDAMLFGEHLGSRDWWENQEGDYLNRGMRIANDGYIHSMEGIGDSLAGMDARGFGIWGGEPHHVAHYVMSHDNNYLWGGNSDYPWGNRPQAHALMLAREGLPIVYTDGYNQAGEPDWFPKPAQVPFLGQFPGAWRGAWLPNLLHIRRHFGWGGHWSKWSDQDHAVWVRGAGDNHNQASMMFAMVRRYASGDRSPFELVDSVFNEGDILYKYGTWGAFPVQVQEGKIRELNGNAVSVGPGDWWAVSWRLPQMPFAWSMESHWVDEPVRPIMIKQDGEPVETIWVPRRDGRDGDPAFNPYGLPNADTTNHTYNMPVPRVTSSSNLSFVARADGTAANILMKLNGGIDLNAQMWTNRNHRLGARDNPPGRVTDMVLGYEQMRFVHRIAEKFASTDTAHNLWGSPGATYYQATIGTPNVIGNNPSQTPNDWQSTHGPAWLWHNPTNTASHFQPVPESAAGQPVQIEVEIGHHPAAADNKAFIYFTTDGDTYPEGSGGVGKGTTQVAELSWDRVVGEDNHWWVGTIPAQDGGTILRYKIGAYRRNIGARFPWNMDEIELGRRMETKYVVTNFNAGTIQYFPHNNWNPDQLETGLREGFHVLRTKSFLGRDEDHAPIFRERVQTFYYDTERPTGRILWPPNDDEWVSGSYGFVLRTDMTVTEVWYQIYETDGVDETNRPWAKAYRALVPAPLEDGTMEQEWRFDYDDIPVSGWATVTVKLREVSSSTDLELDDEEGHYTTLTRELITGGGYRIFIVDPPAGSTVGHGSNLVVWLSRELWDGIGPEAQLACFSLAVNGVPQTHVQKSLRYDASGEWGDHEITFTLPALYNGDPEFPHTLEVTFERDGFDTRRASRMVYARPEGGLIPPGWELKWGLEPGTLDPSGMGDYDGDGVSDYEEFLANTDPTDPDDFFVVDAIHALSADSIDLEFWARENRHYYIWATESLLSPLWTQVNPNPILGEGLFTNVPLDMEGVTQQYFRLEVTLPEP